MTKEELLIESMLSQACCKSNDWVRKDFTDEVKDGRHDYSLNAMDEWALQFVKWLQKTSYSQCMEDNKWISMKPEDNETLTTEELYQLFINSK